MVDFLAAYQRREDFSEHPYEAPRGAAETAVAQVLAEVLEVDRVGRFDSFTDFAGTSLHAVRACAQIADRLGVPVSPAALFDADDLADFVGRLITPVGGGWYGRQLIAEPQRWRLPVPSDVSAELLTAAASAANAGQQPGILDGRPEGLPRTEEFAEEVRNRLRSDTGFVVLTDFPVDTGDQQQIASAYWTLGLLLGRPVSQSSKGDLLGRVENRGADITSPVQRGYESSAALPFHADRTDVIGLLCIRQAGEGGLSRLVSSRTIHDLLQAEEPELLQELYATLPNDRRGEEQPGEAPWSPLPVFSRTAGDFAARYVRRFIEGSQRHPQAPRLTATQLTAMDTVDALLERPGLSLDMELRPGDLQLINNFTILHARSAFTDGGHGAGRLLLRLWLAYAYSPELPAAFGSLYGSTAAGSYRGGVWGTGLVPATMGTHVDNLAQPDGPR